MKLSDTFVSLGLALQDEDACPLVKKHMKLLGFFYLAFLTEVKGKVFAVFLLNWWATEEPQPPGQLADAVKTPLFSLRIVGIPWTENCRHIEKGWPGQDREQLNMIKDAWFLNLLYKRKVSTALTAVSLQIEINSQQEFSIR